MLADSAAELFAARAALYEVARAIDAGEDRKVLHARASMIKLLCSETAGRIADRAVQVFGGRGYMRENVAERMFRELRVERIWEGASEIQRVIVGQQLLKRGPAAVLGDDCLDAASGCSSSSGRTGRAESHHVRRRVVAVPHVEDAATGRLAEQRAVLRVVGAEAAARP